MIAVWGKFTLFLNEPLEPENDLVSKNEKLGGKIFS